MRIGVLTAGGDAPGLNAAVRALGRRAFAHDHELHGIRNGWAGLASDVDDFELTRTELSGILNEGGTLLGSVRFNLDDPAGGRDRVLANIADNYDAVVAMGGDGTMTIAKWLAQRGCPIVGVPKTLDNDLSATEYCIGFDTAVGIVTEALDRLHTTAASHHRVMVLETMGHATGWVAAMGGLAGGADFIVIPEFPVTIEEIVTHLHHRRSRGSTFSIVVVAEGVSFASLHGGDFTTEDPAFVKGMHKFEHSVGHFVAHEIHKRTDFETRCTVLGHVQRGGSPSSYDRIWATHVGAAAYDAVAEEAWGTIPVIQSDRVVRVPISDVIDTAHTVPRELYDLCANFF